MKKRNGILLVFLLVFSAVLAVSAYKAASILIKSQKENQKFEELASLAAEQRIELAIPSDESVLPDTAPSLTMLSQYAPLHEVNPDLFGWIRIEGTKIDYPVMYTPNDPERYLHLSFDKEPSSSGVPFLDASCDPDGNHYLLHGHHMKNGSMFAAIMKYEKEDFWKEHPIIQFDTLYHTGEYEVLAAFYTQIYSETQTDVFKYYQYPDLSDPDVFLEYLTGIRASALYDTGIQAEYGDTILTLSTCSYHTEDGRFVVAARKKEQH